MPTTTLLAAAIRSVTLPHDADSVDAFARALRAEPRYFGPSSTPKPSASMVAELVALAGSSARGAFVQHELVGLAGLCSRSGRDADLYIAVRAPWRGAGVGRGLADGLLSSEERNQFELIRLRTDRRNRAALALGAAVGMERADFGHGRVELRIDRAPDIGYIGRRRAGRVEPS